jgi:hypothetical protein
LILLLSLAAPTAEASCSVAEVLSSGFIYTNPGCQSGGCDWLPNAPYGSITSYYVEGWFWSLGTGDPAVGPGNDSGANGGGYPAHYYWIQQPFSYPDYPTWIAGVYAHWAMPGADGCIDLDGSNPTGSDDQQCNVVLLDDEDDQGIGYFALLAQNPTSSGAYNMGGPSHTSGPILMQPIPKPALTLVSHTSSSVGFTVSVPAPALPAVWMQCSSAQNTNLQSSARYHIYQKQAVNPLPLIAPAPTDRRLNSPPEGAWSHLAGPFAIGSVNPITVNCPASGASGSSSIWLCATLEFDPHGGVPGFETQMCSESATRVECGANLADPVNLQPKKPSSIDRLPPRGTSTDRGRTGGAR